MFIFILQFPKCAEYAYNEIYYRFRLVKQYYTFLLYSDKLFNLNIYYKFIEVKLINLIALSLTLITVIVQS